MERLVKNGLGLPEVAQLLQGVAKTAQGAKLVIGAVQGLPPAGGGSKRLDGLSWVILGQSDDTLPFIVSRFCFQATDLRRGPVPAGPNRRGPPADLQKQGVWLTTGRRRATAAY